VGLRGCSARRMGTIFMPIRVIVADDEPQILAAYKVCLDIDASALHTARIDAMGDALFGANEAPEASSAPEVRTDYVDQGQAAVDAVASAVKEGDPYAVLFLDMRMPPGMDGYETAKLVRALDPNINIVIVTGYSDHSPLQVAKVAGPLDKLYYLAKPFEIDEIRQLGASLSSKWAMEAELKATQVALEEKVVELQASEARCRHQSLHDHLTRLPNRHAFQEKLAESIADRRQDVAVLFVDLDRFKLVNDTLGHGAGDELVCRIGDRMTRELADKAFVARLGGDEFGIVLSGDHAQDAQSVSEQLVLLCAEQFDLFGTTVQVSASVGYATRGDAFVDAADLLRRADLALYAAKQEGRACARAFLPAMDESSRKRAEIDLRLRQVLAADALTLAYQPIVDPFDGSPIGYEALLRWDDAEHGMIPPSIFVPIAEETGLIVPLGEWVIRRALRDCATWDAGIVSINISTRQFQAQTLVEFVVNEAASAGVPHARIQLEITETALFDDAVLAAEILVELRNHGIRIALDDFGTGYSSLVNLKDFEIDCIKIDQSFVASLGTDRQTSAIVSSVTSLARALGLRVVAEGVENELQVQALRMVGCDLMQGYFYSAPMKECDLPYLSVAQNLPSLASANDRAKAA
jgi:diguanylate cyclase (GGDEF)-like protein